MNSEFLQRYILTCCQNNTGGLRDKPSAYRDLYHTNYSLCGLSYSQNYTSISLPIIFGSEDNLIEPCHPVYGISIKKANDAKKFFGVLECSHDYFMKNN